MSRYTEMPKNWYYPEPRRGKWVTIFPVYWAIGHINGPIYTVPENTTFDVSVPRYLTWLFDPYDKRFMKAACLHDHMLKMGWDRPTAGAIFNDALRAEGVSKLKRWAMFTGVTWFKWS